MTTSLQIDASDIVQLRRAIANLPGEIKTKAMARAMRRMRDMARTRVVKRNAQHSDMPQRVIRDLTTATFNAGGNSISVIEKSGWVPLYKLGATQTARGVRVRTRGSYRHAFLATMKSGHVGVFRRQIDRVTVKTRKNPIRELFGANPSHAITNNPDVYLALLAELIEEHLAPRIMHEIDRLLPR